MSSNPITPPALPSLSTQHQPSVPRQLILCIILCLALNSVSQHGGRICGLQLSRKYRVYICSSPIICAADALSIIIGVAEAYYRLPHDSLSDAARFIVYHRFHRGKKETAATRSWPDRGPDTSGYDRSWSRRVFFLVGALPAFVLLISFSGVRWSQIWGAMFMISYLVIESTLVLATAVGTKTHGEEKGHGRRPQSHAHSPTSTASALGYTADRMSLDHNDNNDALQKKIDSVSSWTSGLGSLLFYLSLIAQLVLTAWTFRSAWQPIKEIQFEVSENVYELYKRMPAILVYGIYAAFGYAVFASLINSYFGEVIPSRFKLSPHTALKPWNLVGWLGAWNILGPTVTVREGDGGKERQSVTKDERKDMKLWWYICVVGLGYQSIAWVVVTLCKRFPRLGEWLLVSHRAEELEEHENEKNGSEVEKDRVDERGTDLIGGLVFHVCVTVMWYVLKYDPAGTSRPSWI